MMTTRPEEPSKVALVTGSSGGIGSAVARRLARQGYSLFLVYGKQQSAAAAVAAECRALGVEVEPCAVDLRDLECTERLVSDCVRRFGRLTAVVHCAGIPQESLLMTLDNAAVQELIAVHITSTVTLTRAAIHPMLLQRFGRIVLLSSVAAQKPSQGAAVYAGCKGFVESFVRAMAVEVGRKGITVNAVAPGMVDTKMIDGVKALVGPKLAERSAVKRLACPDEIAYAVEFLCGQNCSYVNGHVLAVDGGYLGPP